MDVTQLTEKDISMTDKDLFELVHKDVISARYFYYGKFDKNWLYCKDFYDENGDFNNKKLVDFLSAGAKRMIVDRYTKLTFEPETVEKLEIEGPVISTITERTDEEGTWIVCQITWRYWSTDENGKKVPMVTLAGLKFSKTDYIAPIKVDNEFYMSHPELAKKLKENQFTAISAKDALQLAKDNVK